MTSGVVFHLLTAAQLYNPTLLLDTCMTEELSVTDSAVAV